MTFNYAALKNTATRLLTQFGQTATLRKTSGSYNTATGKNTITNSDTSVKAVLLDYKMSVKNQPGSLVREADRQVYMSATGAVPAPNDKIIMGAVEFTIVEVPVILNPGGTTLLYELHVRK